MNLGNEFLITHFASRIESRKKKYFVLNSPFPLKIKDDLFLHKIEKVFYSMWIIEKFILWSLRI